MVKKRLLIITDNSYLSAFLFHGFGIPPWSDLPAIQEDRKYREEMTDHVNDIIGKGENAGFDCFDIHEVFPVNLMRISANAEIIRNVDRFLTDRKYSGVARLRHKFPGLKKQLRWSLIRKMTLNGEKVDENRLISLYLNDQKIPEVYSELGSKSEAVFQSGKDKIVNKKVFPASFDIEFNKKVNLRYADAYPGIKKVNDSVVKCRVSNVNELMGIYKYAGMLIISSGIW